MRCYFESSLAGRGLMATLGLFIDIALDSLTLPISNLETEILITMQSIFWNNIQMNVPGDSFDGRPMVVARAHSLCSDCSSSRGAFLEWLE